MLKSIKVTQNTMKLIENLNSLNIRGCYKGIEHFHIFQQLQVQFIAQNVGQIGVLKIHYISCYLLPPVATLKEMNLAGQTIEYTLETVSITDRPVLNNRCHMNMSTLYWKMYGMIGSYTTHSMQVTIITYHWAYFELKLILQLIDQLKRAQRRAIHLVHE